ncbi:hypothetical protein OMCYN_01672 [cyanobiont of Ornithocercus magnificus]|nr:hypothetical protein OMCYN_01672 [cyanobiont of Ornithocercus magnificus]
MQVHPMTTTQTQSKPAVANAAGWADEIKAAYEAWQFYRQQTEESSLSTAARSFLNQHGLRDSIYDDVAEAIEEAMRESVLSVEVRSGWYSPGWAQAEPVEFRLMLSSGGPALRITGDLSFHPYPRDCVMAYQDWDTPWTCYDDVDRDALEWFCCLFYWGDGS